jgi:hypothetical protein
MKNSSLLIFLLIMLSVFQSTQAQTIISQGNNNSIEKKNMIKGEKIFNKQADRCLEIMEQTALKLSIQGAAIVAFIPGDVTESWIEKMKIVGKLTDAKSNFLAIANSKAAEMAETHKDSGSGIRDPKSGEFGYKGGVTIKVTSGYIMAVFSGGSGEQDVEVAKAGLDYLVTFYQQ